MKTHLDGLKEALEIATAHRDHCNVTRAECAPGSRSESEWTWAYSSADIVARRIRRLIDEASPRALAADGYPIGWPRCVGGCGGPALDGKATCGDVGCQEVRT